MAEKSEKKPDDGEWVDPYTKQRFLGQDMVEALRRRLQQGPDADLLPLAAGCLVELYKEQFMTQPEISVKYQKLHVPFQSSFTLIPARGAIGGMRAWKSMTTALDQLNERSSGFQEGSDLMLVSPPARKDGRMHISVRDMEEIVQLIRTQRPDVYERAEAHLQQGMNYIKTDSKGVGE